jgi:transcriptional regulator with XRE-family HTH domain
MPLVETVRPNGKAIRAARTRQGLSARHLAAMIHRHEKSITKLESSKNALASQVFINQIANALKVDVNTLIRSDEDTADEPGGAAAA